MRAKLLIFNLIFTSVAAVAGNYLDELPQFSTIAPGYENVDSVEARLRELPLCPAEGLWQMTGGGALFAIERAEPHNDLAPGALRMIMIRCSWRSVRPGTVIGHIVPTVKPGVYEARIYSSTAHRTSLSIPRKFLLKLNSDADLLTIEPFRSPLKVNIFKLLPYFYRRVITVQDSRPTDLDGAVRVYPTQSRHPLSPVYL